MVERHTKFSPLSNAVKMAAVVLSLIGILGLLGTGVCEHIVANAPPAAAQEAGLTEAVMFKGHQRFVTQGTANLCIASESVAAAGIGAGLLLGLALYAFFGRLPHE
ncbi:hypothetical protein RSO01_88260 [Reyranella soli]|uniref:PDGLE domain-containing protein n=1 Tax=Reyranella soli TaxID=1230389 RepID=A0A512NRT1_9HYPH|nr:hypothetical protein RSO01_88260 [Reyranella soli]